MSKKNLIIDVKNVSRYYGKEHSLVKALENVSMQVYEKSFLTITGPSGSGKSTLLNILGFLIGPTKGEVFFEGKKMMYDDYDKMAGFRHEKIGIIFQSFNLIPVLTAKENVLVPLIIQKDITEKEKENRAQVLLEAVGLKNQADQYPAELSGGEKQRVAIARALICNPAVVLADEPTANLDTKSAEEVLKVMRDLNEKSETAFIFSTHDPRVIQYAKEKLELKDGRVV
ncbi:MAG: ABC transporter ATP-binding protein [Spirochaetia bacterium]|nr:ABC transporter ATP-binding protein [Spirochaetia bacterium]